MVKITCLQFQPVHGNVKESIKKANSLLQNLSPTNVLILPEMSFTGYIFTSRQEVLQLAIENESIQWAKETALKLVCQVIIGFPQLVQDALFNSIAVIDSDATILQIYQKTFLYSKDEIWAQEGPGFAFCEGIFGLEKVGLSICMDLNPKQFKAPFDAYELASFHLNGKSKGLICCMNWSDNEDPNNASEERSLKNISYWWERLRPLRDSDFFFIACNRVGTEEDSSSFCGSSCFMAWKSGAKYPYVLKFLNPVEESVLNIDLDSY